MVAASSGSILVPGTRTAHRQWQAQAPLAGEPAGPADSEAAAGVLRTRMGTLAHLGAGLLRCRSAPGPAT
jgi:hypothetical protein